MKLICKSIAVVLMSLLLMLCLATPAYAAEIEGMTAESASQSFTIVRERIVEDADANNETEEITEEEPKIYKISDILAGKISGQEWEDIYAYYIEETVGVPLMFQTDYPDIPFSHGTVYTSACGVSCASMVVKCLTGEDVNPGMFGEMFNVPGISNLERMERALRYYDVEFTKTWDWEEVYKALENNQVVISLQSPGLFTSYGHFIVLTGINEDGLITVNDPYEPNYYHPAERVYGYEYGFEEWQITASDGCYWIFEKKDVPNIEFIGDLEMLGMLLEGKLSYSATAE